MSSVQPLTIQDIGIGQRVFVYEFQQIIEHEVIKRTHKTVQLKGLTDFGFIYTYNQSNLPKCFATFNGAVDYVIKDIRAKMDQFVTNSLEEIEALKGAKNIE